jgi:hypothetical protein
MNGGYFYTDHTTEIIIDTQLPHPVPSQDVLLESLRRCSDLMQRDMRYAHLVAGASKMPMGMIWAARNQEELVNDTDLAKLKDMAWNELIKKRYLPSISGGQSFANAASSMLEIVREMNLQRRRFQIMGLHEQVEASEIQLVLHLCQARILHPTTNTQGEYRSLANRFRRHDRFYEAFALAVGAFVCSSAPFTLGAATTRYERDLQYEYKKHTTALFVYVLQQHPGALGEAGAYDEDYVLRISRLIVVWPAGGGGNGGGGGCETLPDAPGPPGGGADCPSKASLLEAAIAAQTMAEKAEHAAGKAERAMRKEAEKMRGELQNGVDKMREGVDAFRRELEGKFQESVEKAEEFGAELEDRMAAIHEAIGKEQSERTDLENRLMQRMNQTLINWLLSERHGGISSSSGGDPGKTGVEQIMELVKKELEKDMNSKMETKENSLRESLERDMETRLDEMGRQTESLKDAFDKEMKETLERESKTTLDTLQKSNASAMAEETGRFSTQLDIINQHIQQLFGILNGMTGASTAVPGHVSPGAQQPLSGPDGGDFIRTAVSQWAQKIDQLLNQHSSNLQTITAQFEAEKQRLTQFMEKIETRDAEMEQSDEPAADSQPEAENADLKQMKRDINFIRAWMDWDDDEQEPKSFQEMCKIVYDTMEEGTEDRVQGLLDEQFDEIRKELQQVERRNTSTQSADTGESHPKRRRRYDDSDGEPETGNSIEDEEFIKRLETLIDERIAMRPTPPAYHHPATPMENEEGPAARQARTPAPMANDADIMRRLTQLERFMRESTRRYEYDQLAETRPPNANFAPASPPP